MKKIYDLRKQEWKEDLLHVHCPQSKAFVPLIEDENGVGCGMNSDIGEHDYTTMISKKKYDSGVTLSAKFTFYGLAAPLLVISEDINTTKEIPLLELFFEVVAWRNGCNIWRLDHLPKKKERPYRATKLLCNKFSAEEGVEHEMKAKFYGKNIEVWFAGHNFFIYNPDLPEKFHVGFTACEGDCRFTEFAIETEDK